MFDRSIPMIGLVMQADNLKDLPVFELPDKYACRFFQPGDAQNWARIETSADGIPDPEKGLKHFKMWFPTDERLDERMMFFTESGVPFATSTAWFDEADKNRGRVHWVCIDAEHQGQDLSKVLVYRTLKRMRELGHTSAYLTTQTSSWVAIKVYHKFGFRPLITSKEEIEGWKIVSEKTGIDFMNYIG